MMKEAQFSNIEIIFDGSSEQRVNIFENLSISLEKFGFSLENSYESLKSCSISLEKQ